MPQLQGCSLSLPVAVCGFFSFQLAPSSESFRCSPALVGDRQPASQLNKRIGRQTDQVPHTHRPSSPIPTPCHHPRCSPAVVHQSYTGCRSVGSYVAISFPGLLHSPLPVLSVLSCLVQPSLIQSSRAEPSPVPYSYPCAVCSSCRSRDSVQWWLSVPISLPACSPVSISAALD